ncbi:MAG: ATP-binding protein [Polyangiaceae bacterium]
MVPIAGIETPDELRARTAVADLIDEHLEDIIACWLAKVRAEVAVGKDVDATQLRDAMPDYLRRISQTLRTVAEPLLHRSGSGIWADVAREHALTRVRHGFDIDQLVHEFIVLRQVLSAVAHEKYVGLDAVQAARIADLIEAAISVAVKSYVEARDFAARQREAKHIAFLTHELRNPLSAAALAAVQLRPLAPADWARLLDVLDRNLGRLATLIDNVLHAERLEAGKVEPKITDVSLGDVLAQPVINARMAAEAKGQRLLASYDPRISLRADPGLVTSAVSNVLDNAVKYSDPGEIRMTTDVGDTSVTLHVYDQCPGLSEAELAVIFEPFERGLTRKPGSGIGLAVARRAIEALGGSIGAESPGERGCHFWITLPRAPPA